MTGTRVAGESEHQEVSALIPWYVNSRLADNERQRVEEHIAGCDGCRADLALERRIFEGIKGAPTIEYMPAASLKRLQAKLNALQSGTASADTLPLEEARRRWPTRRLAAASIAVIAVAMSLLLADRWMQFRARQAASSYHTVTNSAPRARDEVIRAVFSPTITMVDVQAILDEAELHIISGPTEAGVYSLASNTSRPVRSSLALLRRHTAVRFAEQTGPEPEPGTTP